MKRRNQPLSAAALGFTLIELVVAIVVISIAVASILSVLSAVAINSSRALVQKQAADLANACLQNLMTQPTYAALPTANCNVSMPGFTIAHAVVTPSAAPFAGIGSLRIDVSVTDPTGTSLLLSGYRTVHP